MSLYRKILDYLLPYWKHMLISMISMLIFALLSGILIWLLGPLMTTLFDYDTGFGTDTAIEMVQTDQGQQSDGQKIVGGFEKFRENLKDFVNSIIIAETKLGTLKNLCIAIVLIALGKSLFFYTQGYFMAYVEQKFIRNLRVDLFIHYQKLSLAYFHGTRHRAVDFACYQ